jgi:REP element-mobilizing transposase RayT
MLRIIVASSHFFCETARMASTLVCHYVHIVFSTKDRQAWIADSFASRLYAYIGGVARNRDCDLIAAGGVEDHIHLLVSLHQSCALAELMRDIKANSSRFVHDEIHLPNFEWQNGYAAFSVSKSNVDAVIMYINTQRERHAARTFKDELISFLEKHGVEYNPEYVFG